MNLIGSIDFDSLIQSVISLLVLAAPFDPVKIMVFNEAVPDKSQRRDAALSLSFYVAVILGLSALIGKRFLGLIGIDLRVFAAVGGLVILLMGFEMLYGGGSSKAQGEEKRKTGPEDDDAIIVPLALPLIAGPGAITTVITIASKSGRTVEALIGVFAVTLATWLTFAFFASAIEKVHPKTIRILARIGGLLLATIGAQMMMGGIKNFFFG